MFQERFSLGGRYLAPPFSSMNALTAMFVSHRHWTFSRRRKTVWTLPSLWTQRTRPQRLAKPQRTRFRATPTPIISFSGKEETRRRNDSTEAASVPTQIVSTEGFTPNPHMEQSWNRVRTVMAQRRVRTVWRRVAVRGVRWRGVRALAGRRDPGGAAGHRGPGAGGRALLVGGVDPEEADTSARRQSAPRVARAEPPPTTPSLPMEQTWNTARTVMAQRRVRTTLSRRLRDGVSV